MANQLLPKLKKKVGTFISEEQGEITKEGVFKVGIIISSISIGTMASVQADNGGGDNGGGGGGIWEQPSIGEPVVCPEESEQLITADCPAGVQPEGCPHEVLQPETCHNQSCDVTHRNTFSQNTCHDRCAPCPRSYHESWNCDELATGHYNHLEGVSGFIDEDFSLVSTHQHCTENCHAQHSQHCSHTSHSSHGSHGSHGQW